MKGSAVDFCNSSVSSPLFLFPAHNAPRQVQKFFCIGQDCYENRGFCFSTLIFVFPFREKM